MNLNEEKTWHVIVECHLNPVDINESYWEHLD